jgi:hypothetical protein
MVERLLCKQDVSGSSPLTSTKKEKKKLSTITLKRKRVRMLGFKKPRH